jgi:hypothetical protein
VRLISIPQFYLSRVAIAIPLLYATTTFFPVGNTLLTCYLQDIISGDEIISDSYDMNEIDNIAYEVDCQMITLGAMNIGESSKNTTAYQNRHSYFCQ